MNIFTTICLPKIGRQIFFLLYLLVSSGAIVYQSIQENFPSSIRYIGILVFL